jgi:large subunit ribosomal protein L10
MSKAVKNLMIRDYKSRLGNTSDALVVSIRGMKALDNNRLRNELSRKNIRIAVIRNDLARVAFKGGPLANLDPLLSGPNALAFGGDSIVDVARELVSWAEKTATLELRGAVLDGELFEGKKGVERLSKFPTRDEAKAKVITLVLSPGRKVMGQVKGPGARVAGIVKTIADKLEKGEAIAKIA